MPPFLPPHSSEENNGKILAQVLLIGGGRSAPGLTSVAVSGIMYQNNVAQPLYNPVV